MAVKYTGDTVTKDDQSVQHTQKTVRATKRKRTTTRVSSTTTANSVTITMSLLGLYILLLTVITVPVKAEYTLYKPKSGIHIEHIGTGKICRGSFRIDVPYNYTKLTDDINSISESVQQMDHLCKNMQYQEGEGSCSDLILHLGKLEDYVINIKIKLDDYIVYKPGKIVTTLPNAESSTYIDILHLKTIQEELIDDSENIFLSTVSIPKEEGIEMKFKENFQNSLQAATDYMNLKPKTSVSFHQNLLQKHFVSAYHTASVYINETINHYIKLLKIVTQQGNLYDLLSLDHVNEIISLAMEKLPPGVMILSKPILNTSISRDGDIMYIHGNFPVIGNNNFTLLEIIPVPLEIEGNSYLTLDIPNGILAFDYSMQLYFYLSNEELSKSVRLKNDIYLCTPKVIRKMQEYPICVLDHIYKPSKNKACQTKRTDIMSIIWKELYTKNAWMFITNKPTNVAVLCNNIRETVPIDKSGIIKIPQNCVIRSKRSVLSSKIEDDIYTPPAYTEDVQTELNKPIPQASSKSLQDAIKEPAKKVFEMLRNMNGEVKEFQSHLKNNDSKNMQQSVFSNVVAGVSVVSVILVALVTYRTSEPFWRILLEYICTSQISSVPNETTRLLQNS